LLAILFGTIIGGSIFLWQNFSASAESNGKIIDFEIVPGEQSQSIAERLQKNQIISSKWSFLIYAKINHLSLKAGFYELDQNLTTKQIAQKLAKGEVSQFKITIPEGWRIKQIDQLLTKKKIINSGELDQMTKDKEGFLFPDTYKFNTKVKTEEIVQSMEKNFQLRTADLKPSREQIILASIIEREAKKDEDRPKIAGVFQNRLANSMKLEADPTIQYALGNWEPITQTDYSSVESPYNTYKINGLPPTPICNPGIKSILAAVNPEKNDFFFFFHTNDGETIFSKTLEEHQQHQNQLLK
jgi:UPF0755 protein